MCIIVRFLSLHLRVSESEGVSESMSVCVRMSN